MEYHIHLEEDRVRYVCGRFKRCAGSGLRHCPEMAEWEFVEPVPDVASVLTCLVERYSMGGERVNLITRRDVRMVNFAIPKAGKSVMKRMAVNEMSLLNPDFGNHATVLDLRAKTGRTMADVIAYYMEQRSLDAYKKAVEDGKMICGRVLVLSDCMVITARELWREGRIPLLDANQASMGFYVLSGGHCLACRVTGLRTGCSLREGAVDILRGEIAEQVEDLIQDCTVMSDVPTPDCMVLMASCIPDAQAVAEYMSGRSGMSCNVRMPEPVDAVCLAICATGSPEGKRKVPELEGRGYEDGKNSILGRGSSMVGDWALLLLASELAAAELSFRTAYVDHAVGEVLARTEYAMGGTEYKTHVHKSVEMEERIDEMPAGREKVRTRKVLLVGKNLPGMNEFRAFTEAMNPEMRVRSISFSDERPYLQMAVSIDRSEDVSAYVKRAEHSGIFRQVGHSLREKSVKSKETERIYVTIYGTPGMGGQGEAQ